MCQAKFKSNVPLWSYLQKMILKTHIVTRSQAVTRIADRTASQLLRGSRDVIGHVTVW